MSKSYFVPMSLINYLHGYPVVGKEEPPDLTCHACGEEWWAGLKGRFYQLKYYVGYNDMCLWEIIWENRKR